MAAILIRWLNRLLQGEVAIAHPPQLGDTVDAGASPNCKPSGAELEAAHDLAFP